MKKVTIDKNKCIGCGACVENSNDCIEFDNDGKVICIKEMEDNTAERIKKNCPVEAIK